jgi:hypothetical protein
VNPTDLFILGAIVGMLVFWQCYKWWRAMRLGRKVARARRGERRALDLLEANGYEILELQKRVPVCTKLDGKECKTYIAADALVRKRGLLYVAEIKTGSEATRVTHAPTRRQLLEYYFVFQPHGILLVDMEQGKIRTVEFMIDRIETRLTHWGGMIICLLLGIFCGWYLRGGL